MKRRILSIITVLALCLTLLPTAAFAAEVGYLDAGGPGTCTVFTELTEAYLAENSNTLAGSSEGTWYAVSGEVTAANRIIVSGTVHLILQDDCHLDAQKGIEVSAGNSLTIYAQSTGANMGKLTAVGANYDAGIGSKGIQSGVAAGTITINGGNITARGAYSGAGIGGGWCGTGGTITINGGTVSASSEGNGPCIGDGAYTNGAGTMVAINGGYVIATDCGYGTDGIGRGEQGTPNPSPYEGRFSAGGSAVIFAKSIGDQSQKGAWCGIIFEGSGGKVYGNQTLTEDLEIPEGKTLTVPSGTTLTIAENVTLTNNGIFTNSGTVTNNGAISGTGVNNGNAISENQPSMSVKYLDAGKQEQSASTVTELTAGTTSMSAGWYVASGSFTIPSRVTVDGDVHLILRNSCNLTVEGGIEVSQGNSLTVYAQSTQYSVSQLTATGADGNAGIGSGQGTAGGAVTIYGGKVTATGGAEGGAGIGGGQGGAGGSVTIQGGTVTATGKDGAADIGKGKDGSGDGAFSTGSGGTALIYVSSVDAAGISDQSGRDNWQCIIFAGNDGTVFGDQNYSSALSNGSGKTLLIPENATLSVSRSDSFDFFRHGTVYVDGTLNMGMSEIDHMPIEATILYKLTVSGGTADVAGGESGITSGYVAKDKTITLTPADGPWFVNGEALVGNSFTMPARVTAAIFQNTNEWLTQPSIAGWTAGNAVKAPTYEAKYGNDTVIVEYKAASAQDDAYTTTVPTSAGSYTVRFTVVATNSYTGLEATAALTIAARPAVDNSGSGSSSSSSSGSSVPSTSTETKADGSTITTTTKPDGFRTESMVSKPVTNPDGSTSQTTTEITTGKDGVTESKTETVTKPDGSGFATTETTTTKPDGSKTESTTETTINKDGSTASTTTSTTTDKDGTVTESKTEATISTVTNKDGSTTETRQETTTTSTGSKMESTTVTTVRKDGSSTATTTTTTTDKAGTVTESKTEVTTKKDGSGTEKTTATETKDNGTVTESKTETTINKDGSSKATTTETVTKADGTKVESKTTATTSLSTNKTTGTVTETKKETTTTSDGVKSESTTVTQIQKDGTVTSKETVKASDSTGTTATKTTTLDAKGNVTTTAEASVSTKAVTEAAKTGGAVTLPVEVTATKSASTAPTVAVSVPKAAESVKVELPVQNVTPGTVAVIVNADGTEKIVSTSMVTENGVALTLEGSATVKLVDNSKSFTDVPETNVFYNEIASLSAREIMIGKTGDKFDLYSSVTLDQIANVVGRIIGAVDVKDFNAGVAWGQAAGLRTGNVSATRGDVLKALYMAAGSPAVEDTTILSRFKDASAIPADMAAIAAWAARNDILKGGLDGNANLTGNVTRGQVCALAGRTMGVLT